jgi:RNA polymerase sigma factor (sigma-70 family)
MRVHDSDVSAPPVPGGAIPDAEYDAAWVIEAYDSFADSLYAYCRSLVQEPAAAADAVQDTFVVTAFRLADLPDESLLRAWLHAVARNECLRAISQGAAPALDFQASDAAAKPLPSGDGTAAISREDASQGHAPAPDETSPDLLAGDIEYANARALLRAALGGLDAPARDLMIMTWHGLDIAECAVVLGLSHDAASKLLFRGRDQLEESAGVLAVTRSGWRECAQLNGMLDGWDGRLAPALRGQLRQHVDHCDLCGDQRRAGMGPAVLLRLAPEALRGMATGGSRLTAWVTSRLREQVLAAAFDTEPASFEHRAMVVRRAGPFRDDGFPVALAPPGAAAARKRRFPVPLVLAGAGGTALLAATALAALVLSGNYSTGAMPSWTGLAHPVTTSASGASSAAPSASASPRASASASRSAATSSPTPTPTPTPKPSSSAPPSASARPSATTVAKSSAPATAKPGAAPNAPSIGVSPGSLLLTQQRWGGGYGGWLALINPTNAPMNWSISLPSNLGIWHNQTSGQLPAFSNEQTRLYIFYAGRGQGQGQGQQSVTETITLQPGNVQVQVTIP